MALQKRLYMFNGLQFFFVPNHNSKVYFHRKNIARGGKAIVNRRFSPENTTHILVDEHLFKRKAHLVNVLRKEGVTALCVDKIKVLKQEWLVDCIADAELKKTDVYEIPLSSEFFPDKENPHFLVPKDQLVLKPGTGEQIKVPKTSNLKSVTGKLLDEVDPPKEEKAQGVRKVKKFKRVDTLEESLRLENDFSNPNKRVIEVLERLADQQLLQGQDFKAKSYRTAVETLKNQTVLVTTAKYAQELPGIGVSIAKKIEQVALNQRFPELEDVERSQESKLLRLFTAIHGVGPGFAKRWIMEGMKSLDDIKQRTDLTKPQRLGLEYYDDWKEKIPRKECTEHLNYLNKVMSTIDPKVQLTIGGSYRRGALECGDVDFILTKPRAKINKLKEILIKLEAKLEETGYLRCTLNKPSTKLLAGCSLLPNENREATGVHSLGKCRRVDILLVPWSEMGAALIYFTGNDYFNRKLRTRAIKMNLVLNESGLFKRITYQQGRNIKDREMLIESANEKKIFKLLGVSYEEPEARNIGIGDELVKVEPEKIDVQKLKKLAMESANHSDESPKDKK